MKTKPSTEKNQSSIEQKKVIEEEQNEEEDQQIDDQEGNLEIDLHILEGTKGNLELAEGIETDQLILEEMVIDQLTLKKNLVKKNHMDQRENLDPKKSLE